MRKKKIMIVKTITELNRMHSDVYPHLLRSLGSKALIYSLEYDRPLFETEMDFFMKHKLYRNDKKNK